MNRVFVLMSSNQNPQDHLQACIDLLAQHCRILAVSPVYQTPAVGEAYQNDFLDAVVMLETPLSPQDFHADVLRRTEQQLGRNRQHHTIPIMIPIDLDILLWNTDSFDFGDKPRHIPDKDIVSQIHLAQPLSDLAPDYIHPETGQSLQAIAKSLSSAEILRRTDIELKA